MTDNGKGIPAEIIHKIFQPFFTNQNALAPDGRPVKGKGLGLSVANQIISEHNGRIEVESEEGKETKFTVILPVIDYQRV